MRTTIIICILSFVLAAGAFAANTFVSGDLGMSMEAPAVRDARNQSYQVAAFFLPPAESFSGNVNVQKQAFPGSLDAYDKLTMDQFRQYNMKVVARSAKGNEIRYEYTGEIGERKIHWYARAIKSGNSVYIATATSLESQWEKEKASLMRSVDSFAVK